MKKRRRRYKACSDKSSAAEHCALKARLQKESILSDALFLERVNEKDTFRSREIWDSFDYQCIFLNNLTNHHLDRKSFMCVNIKDIVHTQQCAKDMSINSVYKENAT